MSHVITQNFDDLPQIWPKLEVRTNQDHTQKHEHDTCEDKKAID